MESSEVYVDLLKENLGEIRHTENHRNNVSGVILVIIGFIVGTIDESSGMDVYAGWFIVSLGLFGAFVTKKLYERQKWYMSRVDLLYKTLDERIDQLNLVELYLQHKNSHSSKFFLLSRVRMNLLWTALYLAIIVFGIFVTVKG